MKGRGSEANLKISDLHPDDRNANKGTKRGRKAVEDSLSRFGAGRSILVDRAGRIIAGNKTVASAAAAGIEDVILVPADGKSIIAVQRIDIDLDSPEGRALGIADNRTAELGLEWDAANLKDFASELDLKPFFTDEELLSLGAKEPDFSPSSESEQGKLDEKNPTECPACGHKFHP